MQASNDQASAQRGPEPRPSVDASLIAELARMTPAERLRLNDGAVRSVLRLREAVRRAER
jgi:hypothetical protein